MAEAEAQLDHYKLMIKWVDGRPVPTYSKMITKEAVSQLPLTVLSLPYERTPLEKECGVDEEYEGMTNGEVAMVRLAKEAARGSYRAIDMLQDRAIGKPKISTENKNINMTYEDLLDVIAKNEGYELESNSVEDL